MISEILNQVDFEKAKVLLEGFNKSTGFVTAILDTDGNILCESGWRQICTDFHRNNPKNNSNCFVSDTTLGKDLSAEHKYHFYKCMNGLIDVRLPIVIRGEHIANLFSGQFFLEVPDISFFEEQANRHGFELKEYLEAQEKVPVVSKAQVETAMDFLLDITKLIIEMTIDKIEQNEIIEAIKISEIALSKSQTLLKQNVKDLMESQRIARLGTWRLDLATNQVVWSKELYNMYGFDPTIPPPPYTEHMKLFTPNSWERLSKSLEQTRTTGTPYELELETITKDGANGWMWVRGEAEKDSAGNIVSLWGAAQDITQHKRIELETKQSEERFQLLFNKAPLGYQSLDYDGFFIDVNQQWLDTLGYDKKDVIGQWFGDFLCPEYVDQFRKRFPIFRSQGYIYSEFEMLCKDGRRVIIAFDGKVGYGSDGKFKQTHCILQDITNQRKAEKALIESENRYRELSEQSRTYTWEVDEQGMYTFVDHACETVLGYRSEELIQKKHFYDLCLDDEREEFKQTIFDTFRQREMFRDMEIKALTKTGARVVLSTNGFPILKDDGSLLCYRGSNTDITARKQIEEDLQKSEERFRVAQEISPDGFTILHPVHSEAGEIIDFTFVYENQAIARLNQTDPKDVIGKRLLAQFPSHRGTSIFETYIHVAKTKEPQIIEEVYIGEVVSVPKWLRLVVISMGEEIAILAQDISERKKVEEELLESQALLKAAFENSPAGIAIADAPDGKLRFVNKAGLMIRDKSEEELVKNIDIHNYVDSWKVLHFDGKPYAEDEVPLARAVLFGETCSDEFVIRRDNFEDRYVLANATPIKDSNGIIKAGMVVFLDVTEKKQAEENIRNQNNLFSSLLKLLPVGVFMVDATEGKPLVVNDMGAALLGSGILPDATEHNLSEVYKAYKGDTKKLYPTSEMPIVLGMKGISSHIDDMVVERPDGTRILLDVFGSSVTDKDGKPWASLVTFMDITERKRSEHELSRIMAQNQRILDNLQDSYFQADLSGKFIVVNPQAVRMYGYSSASELIGQSAKIVYADPEDRLRVIDELNTSGSVTDLVIKGRRKDGETFWVSMNVQFVKDEQGKIIGSEGLVRDISERITMLSEIELQRDNLIESNAKLAHLLDQSVKSISRIGELRDAYTAGHQRKVKDLSCAIAQQLGLSDETIMNLSYGSLIHDIGKIYVPSEILNKPGKISGLELQIIQTHVEYGFKIIKEIDFPNVISTMVYQHHERLDGSGYPLGLSGEQIIIESRILAVADVVEAMTSHRPYRPAVGLDAALEEISKYRGLKFDSDVVDTCIDLFREKGFKFSDSM